MRARRHLPSIERLRALREVARTGRFSAAAAALGLTQPAVSNHVRLLEQQLGTRLLERLGRLAKPTAEGEILIGATSRAFAEIDAALDAIDRIGAAVSGTLVLAAGPIDLMAPIMADLRARFPAIDIRVVMGSTRDLIPGLLDGSIDIGLMTAPVRHRRLSTRLYVRDRLLCVAPPDDAPGTSLIRPRDLEGRDLVLFQRGGSTRSAIDAWLKAADRRRIRIIDVGTPAAQLSFARAGLGWSIISEASAQLDPAAEGFVVLDLDPPLWRDLVIVWRSDRTTRPTIAAALPIFSSHALQRRQAAANSLPFSQLRGEVLAK